MYSKEETVLHSFKNLSKSYIKSRKLCVNRVNAWWKLFTRKMRIKLTNTHPPLVLAG
jgi:hypothetical protein